MVWAGTTEVELHATFICSLIHDLGDEFAAVVHLDRLQQSEVHSNPELSEVLRFVMREVGWQWGSDYCGTPRKCTTLIVRTESPKDVALHVAINLT